MESSNTPKNKAGGHICHTNRVSKRSSLNPIPKDENEKQPEVTAKQLQFTQSDPRGPEFSGGSSV